MYIYVYVHMFVIYIYAYIKCDWNVVLKVKQWEITTIIC